MKIRFSTGKLSKLAGITALTCASMGMGLPAIAQNSVSNPQGTINLIKAPKTPFSGRIFFMNDWDGGDEDNQNTAEELARGSKISENITVLSYMPDVVPRKVEVRNLVRDARVLADASQRGPIAIAMGGHSNHMLAWLTKLPRSEYRYSNIFIVSHSNWNEMDGAAGYNANANPCSNRVAPGPCDGPIADTYGEALRRGLYPNLARIADLGVTIWEIPRTDNPNGRWGDGAWGGRVDKPEGGFEAIKAYDLSDLGLVHYLKTGIRTAYRYQRNSFVSVGQRKPKTTDAINNPDPGNPGNPGNPGSDADYMERNGLVIMELENTDSALDLWTKKTDISGFSGSGYLEFQGRWIRPIVPRSSLSYSFKVQRSGLYYLHMRAASQSIVENGVRRTDTGNDAFIRLEGDFDQGPNVGPNNGDDAPLSALTTDTKFFAGSDRQFVWASGARLDLGGKGNKRVAVYRLKAGETYRFVISGRSKDFRADRVVFRHESVSVSAAQNLNLPETR